MPLSFLPLYMADALTDLTPPRLATLGIDALLLDFDNTIVPYTTDQPTQAILDWLETVRAAGVQLCVVSNSRRPRVARFCETWDLPCVTRAAKPFRRGIREAVSRLGLDPAGTALVGDQIYTDVLGANCAGLISILVRPIRLHNVWLRLRHVLELPMILLARRRLLPER